MIAETWSVELLLKGIVKHQQILHMVKDLQFEGLLILCKSKAGQKMS